MKGLVSINGVPVDIPEIDFSGCRTGKDAADLIMQSDGLFVIGGESDYDVEMSKPETAPRFRIGDAVRLRQSVLDYNGVEWDGKAMVVTGIRKMPRGNCFVYELSKDGYECMYTGNELEALKK